MSHQQNKAIGDAIKGIIGCELCKAKNLPSNFAPNQLEFHHTDPATKKAEVTSLYSVSRSQTLEEISKCEVVCITHHKILDNHIPPNSPIPAPPGAPICR